MRIVVFSDTHGNFAAMKKILMRNGKADLFIFLGDGERDLDKLRIHYIDKKIINVSGNCDYDSMTPENKTVQLDNGMKIFFAHGHRWGVKTSVDLIYQQAESVGAKIALFGHTHCRYAENRNGILILNPGSAGCPRDGLPACYAWIDITESGGLVYNHVEL
jgi:hypothetical protein